MAHMTREERHEAASIRPPCLSKTVTEFCLEGAGPCSWLQVPPGFSQRFMPHVDRMDTVLQNAGGATWRVQLEAKHGFVKGWVEFATGNALAIGDTLVFFSLEEGKKFVVHVFEASGREKGSVQQRDPPLSRPDLNVPLEEQTEVCELQTRCEPPSAEAGLSNVAVEATAKRKRGRRPTHQAPGSSIPLVSRRRAVTKEECKLAKYTATQFASHLVPASTRCVVTLSHSSVYHKSVVLYLPRDFALDYMPLTDREMTLVDTNVTRWNGMWNAKYRYFSGGWRNFAQEHCLEKSDALVIEILQIDATHLTLKVHLFPVVPVNLVVPILSPEGWNSTGNNIEPKALEPPVGILQPHRPRPRKRRVHNKRVYKSSSESENESTTSSHNYD